LRQLILIGIFGLCAAATAQEIELTRPVLQPTPITAIASDGVDAIALWDSTLITRITNDGRSLTLTGTRIAPRAGSSAIAYGNGEYVVAVNGTGFDAIFLDRDGAVIRRVHLGDRIYGVPSIAVSHAGFLLAIGTQAFVLDVSGGLAGVAKLPEDAMAAASDGTRFLVAGQRKATIVDSTGTVAATNDFKTTNYYSDVVAAGFDGTNYVVAWDDNPHNLARRVDPNGVLAGDPLQLHDGTYTKIQAISEDGAVVVAMSFWGSPFAVSRMTESGITTTTPPLGTPLLAPIGSGFIAVDTTATFLTHDFAIDGSRPKGTVVAQAAESQALHTAASNGTSVLAVWERTEYYDGLYAAVVGPNGTTTPVHLDYASNCAAASNGEDFLVVYSTHWYDGVYAVVIRADGTASKPVPFWSIGFRHFVYLGVQWTGDAYFVGFVDDFVDYGGKSYTYYRRISADGAMLGDAAGGGPGINFACGTTTCLATGVNDNSIVGELFDLRTASLRDFGVSPTYSSYPTAGPVVFDGVSYRAFWSFSTTSFSASVSEDGSVGNAIVMPSTPNATFTATGNGIFGAWAAAPNEIATLFIDRNDNIVLGPHIHIRGSVYSVTATTSWLGESLLYTRWTDDTVHGSAERVFLRPVALAHGRAATR
jgi:hypothetical protein